MIHQRLYIFPAPISKTTDNTPPQMRRAITSSDTQVTFRSSNDQSMWSFPFHALFWCPRSLPCGSCTPELYDELSISSMEDYGYYLHWHWYTTLPTSKPLWFNEYISTHHFNNFLRWLKSYSHQTPTSLAYVISRQLVCQWEISANQPTALTSHVT